MSLKDTIKKISFLYKPWHAMRVRINDNNEKRKKEAYRKYGKEALEKISNMFISKNYKAACIEGTLLGLVRDGHIMPWDDDLDFAIVSSTIDWVQLEKDLKEIGFWKYRDIYTEEGQVSTSYKYKNVLCDIGWWNFKNELEDVPYGVYQLPYKKYVNGEYGEYQIWYVQLPKISEVHIENKEGINVLIPNNSEEWLAACYGKNWRTPDPNYKPEREMHEKKYKFIYYRKPISIG